MILLKKQFEKLLKKSKNLLTILSECGKVNKLSARELITWQYLENIKKTWKKFLTDEKRCDKVNELSERQKTKNLDN